MDDAKRSVNCSARDFLAAWWHGAIRYRGVELAYRTIYCSDNRTRDRGGV
jgi:hypothetical protein